MLNINKLLRVIFPLDPHPNTTLFTTLLYALFSRDTNGNRLEMERRRTKDERGTKIMIAVRDFKEKSKMRNVENYTIKTFIICNF